MTIVPLHVHCHLTHTFLPLSESHVQNQFSQKTKLSGVFLVFHCMWIVWMSVANFKSRFFGKELILIKRTGKNYNGNGICEKKESFWGELKLRKVTESGVRERERSI